MPVVPLCLSGNIRYPNLNDSKPSKMKPSRDDFMGHLWIWQNSQNQGCSSDIFLIKLGTTNGEKHDQNISLYATEAGEICLHTFY